MNLKLHNFQIKQSLLLKHLLVVQQAMNYSFTEVV